MYVITHSIYIPKIMTIRQHVVELHMYSRPKFERKPVPAVPKKAARVPKLTALTLCLEGYPPLKNHDHSMSRTGDMKN